MNSGERVREGGGASPPQNIQWASRIKEHHRRIKGAVDGGGDAWAVWSRVLQDKVALQQYATAMHDLATQYWDVGGDATETPSGDRPMGADPQPDAHPTASKRLRESTETRSARGSEGETLEASTMGSISIAPVPPSRRVNDRIRYVLRCIAEYFLGTSAEGDHPQPPTSRCGPLSLLLMPTLLAQSVKPLRRQFYHEHGRMMTPAELEATCLQLMAQEARRSSCCSCPCATCRAGSVSHRPEREQTLLRDSPLRVDPVPVWEKVQAFLGTGRSTCGDVVAVAPPPSLRVLDVGSCYGPFFGKSVSNGLLRVPLCVTAVDIGPYPGSGVHEGDCLNLSFQPPHPCPTPRAPEEHAGLVPDNDRGANALTGPPRFSADAFEVRASSYDVVVFCLLLSYLPTPEMRFRACLNAYLALKQDGLLIIISTRTQGSRRSRWVDEWVRCIESIGFQCVHKQTQEKIVGMAFAKRAAGAAQAEGVAAVRSGDTSSARSPSASRTDSSDGDSTCVCLHGVAAQRWAARQLAQSGAMASMLTITADAM